MPFVSKSSVEAIRPTSSQESVMLPLKGSSMSTMSVVNPEKKKTLKTVYVPQSHFYGRLVPQYNATGKTCTVQCNSISALSETLLQVSHQDLHTTSCTESKCCASWSLKRPLPERINMRFKMHCPILITMATMTSVCFVLMTNSSCVACNDLNEKLCGCTMHEYISSGCCFVSSESISSTGSASMLWDALNQSWRMIDKVWCRKEFYFSHQSDL